MCSSDLGNWYMFDDKGVMKVGFVTIPSQNKTVYYSEDQAKLGQMQYGKTEIKGKTYYFDTFDGAMKTGVFYNKETGTLQYYGNNGQMQYGQRNIDGHWYNFDTYNGAMKTGLVYIPEQNKTVYYGSNGQMQHGVFKLGKITYTADHISGAIIGVYNDAEVIGQNPELPTGCEITAVTMMLRYAGANVNKIQLANEMPRSNNGDYGFVGNPFSVTGWWVFPTGVAPVVNKHLGHSQVMTGASLESIKNKLLNGHLVVAWVANMNGFVNHAIALTGYNGNMLYYNNPWTARKESMSISSFYTHWNADKQRALSY